ncbi:Uncharacterised protein [Mycobacterium tuberculosis]|nr:Uncharacterised protein [Mycobacterium tuberculosis]
MNTTTSGNTTKIVRNVIAMAMRVHRTKNGSVRISCAEGLAGRLITMTGLRPEPQRRASAPSVECG